MPSAASSGWISLEEAVVLRIHQLVRTRAATALVVSAGREPVGPRRVIAARWMRRFSAATRTMKNSSRFELKMARNFTRSSRGTLGSCASSSTRRLNSSHDSSRLTNASVVHVSLSR